MLGEFVFSSLSKSAEKYTAQEQFGILFLSSLTFGVQVEVHEHALKALPCVGWSFTQCVLFEYQLNFDGLDGLKS